MSTTRACGGGVQGAECEHHPRVGEIRAMEGGTLGSLPVTRHDIVRFYTATPAASCDGNKRLGAGNCVFRFRGLQTSCGHGYAINPGFKVNNSKGTITVK